jgi:hypothetical protein
MIHHSFVYFVGHLVCVMAVRGLRELCHPGSNRHVIIFKSPAYVEYDDIRRDSTINFMLTWRKLSFLIGHFEFEV